MVHYKLTYFEARGLGEAIRQLFALAGVEYEQVDFAMGSSEWTDFKPSTPFGHLPVLSVDEFEIPESAAIARYLARKFGYAGKTAEEEAWVDAIVDQFKDFIPAFRALAIAEKTGKSEEEVNKVRQEVFIPAKDAYFHILKKQLEKSKSGFLVGDGLTFADLFVVDNFLTMEKCGYFNPADESKLAEHIKKVNSIPALKAWNEKRPDTQF